MSNRKTYLTTNKNGELIMKEHVVRSPNVLKATLEEKREKRRLAKDEKNSKILSSQLQDIHSMQYVNNMSTMQHNYFEENSGQHKLPVQHNYQEKNFGQHKLPVQHNYQEKNFGQHKLPVQHNYQEKNIGQHMKPVLQVKKMNVIEKPLKSKIYSIVEGDGEIKTLFLKNEVNESGNKGKFFGKICKLIGIYGTPHGKTVTFDQLNDPYLIKSLYDMQMDLRDAFPSSKLTALHKNAQKKQSFPGVNMVRQIMKEMGYRMKPVNYSDGYLGSKKLLRREYKILKL